jgi:hypothetical protein
MEYHKHINKAQGEDEGDNSNCERLARHKRGDQAGFTDMKRKETKGRLKKHIPLNMNLPQREIEVVKKL